MDHERTSASEAIRSVLMILRSSFVAAPARTAITLILYPLGYLETPFIALGLRAATDAVVTGEYRLLAAAVVIVVIGLCVFHILDHTAWQLCLELEDRVGLALDSRINALVSGAPGLEPFERPEYADRLELLRERGWLLGRAMYVLPMNLANLVRAVVTFSLLAAVHPLLLALPLFAIPGILIQTRYERRQRDTEESCVDGLRRARHLYELATGTSAGKEIRVFGLGEELGRRHRAEWMRVHGAEARTRWAATRWSALAWLIFAVGFVGAAALVAARVVVGEATVGDLVLALTLAARVSSEAGVAIHLIGWSQWLARIGGHLLWLEGYAAALPARTTGPRHPAGAMGDGIVLDHVSFRYPGTDRVVLTDVCIRLPAGRTVALVGENGAGKTTLVKLLCGLYAPSSGRILIGGTDLAEMDLESWRGSIAACFQDFCRFEFSAAGTVGVGDLPFLEDVGRIWAALGEADAGDVVKGLPDGLGTRLGARWEGGMDLSVGQWQKLALARSLMRGRPLLLVLDEPTASIDPQTEHALYERRTAAAARAPQAVTLLVSHRFSTVAGADLIVVLADGRVLEQGTHGELVAERGLYAELYTLQARAYTGGMI